MIISTVIKKANLPVDACVAVVPVQELEAWILADLDAVLRLIPSWHPPPHPIPHPETVPSPKEHLRRISRNRATKKDRYVDTWHNPRVAPFLRIDVLAAKCPSFVPFLEFVVRK
jgi:hypothetical protein